MGHSGIPIIVFIGLCSALLAIAINIATSVLPESWKPYLWLAWPTVILLSTVGIGLSIWHHIFTKRSDEALGIAKADLNKRNRQAMLEKVRAIWITGILQQSLYNETLIALGLAEQPDAVVRPLDIVVQRPNPTATLDCVAQICPCRIAVLQLQATRESDL